MEMTKTTGRKDYIPCVCNIGFFLSMLCGIAAAVVVGMLLMSLQLHPILCSLSSILVAAAVLALSSLPVSIGWMINQKVDRISK